MKFTNIPQSLIDTCKHYEGLHDGDLSEIGLQPKLCPAGIWTIGWGHALRDSKGIFVTYKTSYPQVLNKYGSIELEKANSLLNSDLNYYCAKVNSLDVCKNEFQFAALVDFAFNVGFSSLLESTLLKRITLRCDSDLIADAFLMWNKAKNKNGKLVPLVGLTARRKTEAELFNNSKLKFYN